MSITFSFTILRPPIDRGFVEDFLLANASKHRLLQLFLGFPTVRVSADDDPKNPLDRVCDWAGVLFQNLKADFCITIFQNFRPVYEELHPFSEKLEI